MVKSRIVCVCYIKIYCNNIVENTPFHIKIRILLYNIISSFSKGKFNNRHSIPLESKCVMNESKRVVGGLESLKTERGQKSCLKGLFGRDSDSSSCSDDGDDLVEVEVEASNATTPDSDDVIQCHSFGNPIGDVLIAQCRLKGITHQLWPAAVHLTKLIAEKMIPVPDDAPILNYISPMDCVVLELGAGVGLLGLCLAKFGFSKVILTDLPEAMDLLNKNIILNNLTDRVVAEGT